MSDLVKNAPSVDGFSAARCVVISQALAGETLSAGDAVFIHTDGKVYQSDSTDHVDSLTLEAGTTDPVITVSKFDGMINNDYVAGEPVTVFGQGAIFTKYSASQTPGAFYYASNTQGALSDARVAANDSALAKAISATDILVLR